MGRRVRLVWLAWFLTLPALTLFVVGVDQQCVARTPGDDCSIVYLVVAGWLVPWLIGNGLFAFWAVISRQSPSGPLPDAPPVESGRGRGPWLTTAAAVLLLEGVSGLVYAPILTDWTQPTAWPLLLVAACALNLAGGIGILRRRSWGRVLGAGVSSFAVLAVYLPTLARGGDTLETVVALLGLSAHCLVLYAVAFRWRSPSPAGGRRVAAA